MKLGYKIIITIIVLWSGYKYFHNTNKEKLFYENEVNKIVTDLRHQDYFAIQKRLTPKNSKNISIEDIKLFISDFNLSKKAKFSLDSIDKDNNITTVIGSLLDGNRKSMVKINFKDINNTPYIYSQQFGNKTLQIPKTSFPILTN